MAWAGMVARLWRLRLSDFQEPPLWERDWAFEIGVGEQFWGEFCARWFDQDGLEAGLTGVLEGGDAIGVGADQDDSVYGVVG